ncbi:MAG: ATP-dependent Clp protease proteolytic subunit [Planctomycetota bacterium]|nr:ATP-dependent Clp protease proteolytic subunit [Planctomycetota bacterium]
MNASASRMRHYPNVQSTIPSDPPTRDWELSIHGELTDKESDLLPQMIELPRNSKGTLYFDSSGGSVYVGLALATVIRLRGLDPLAVVVGECSSAALLPFAACRRRVVTPHSTLLFHPMRWQSEEDVRLEEATEWARHFKLMEEDLDSLLAKLFETEESLIHKWTRPGRFLTGTDLVEAGLAKMVDLFSGTLWQQDAKA